MKAAQPLSVTIRQIEFQLEKPRSTFNERSAKRCRYGDRGGVT
jgi:hypothetical protein